MGNPWKHQYKGWVPLSGQSQLGQVPAPLGSSLILCRRRRMEVGFWSPRPDVFPAVHPFPMGHSPPHPSSFSPLPHPSFQWKDTLSTRVPADLCASARQLFFHPASNRHKYHKLSLGRFCLVPLRCYCLQGRRCNLDLKNNNLPSISKVSPPSLTIRDLIIPYNQRKKPPGWGWGWHLHCRSSLALAPRTGRSACFGVGRLCSL